MKNLWMAAAFLTAMSANAQTTDTVTLSANYANELWYDLDNGTIVDQPKNDWEIAFEAAPQGASIIINDAAGVELYLYPGDTSQWASLTDTSGLSTWTRQLNSDSTWSLGAFNYSATGHPNYGWGSYNSITHIVEGDKIFVLKMPDGSFQKVWIKDVTSGTFNFMHAPLSSNGMSHSLSVSEFAGKNFAYFSLTNHMKVDKEPMSEDWDLKFGQYVSMVNGPNGPAPYLVAGVLLNKNTRATKAYPISDPSSYQDYQAHLYTSNIGTIGHDWKSFNMQTFQYDIEDSTVYFVETQDGDIWKLIFKGFGGSTDGNFIFEKEKLLEVGLEEVAQLQVLDLYPNPARDVVNLVYRSSQQAILNIFNMQGQSVYSSTLSNEDMIQQIPLTGLKSGMYMLVIDGLEGRIAERLLVE